MKLLKDPKRLRMAMILVVIASGLAVVLCESFFRAILPRNFLLVLRTVFWAAAIGYFWLRLSKRFG